MVSPGVCYYKDDVTREITTNVHVHVVPCAGS